MEDTSCDYRLLPRLGSARQRVDGILCDRLLPADPFSRQRVEDTSCDYRLLPRLWSARQRVDGILCDRLLPEGDTSCYYCGILRPQRRWAKERAVLRVMHIVLRLSVLLFGLSHPTCQQLLIIPSSHFRTLV